MALVSTPVADVAAASTTVRGANWSENVPNWVIRVVDLVSLSALTKALPAERTFSTALELLIEPDASSTSVASSPQDCGITGLAAGVTAAALTSGAAAAGRAVIVDTTNEHAETMTRARVRMLRIPTVSSRSYTYRENRRDSGWAVRMKALRIRAGGPDRSFPGQTGASPPESLTAGDYRESPRHEGQAHGPPRIVPIGVHQNDALPCAQCQPPPDDRDRQTR